MMQRVEAAMRGEVGASLMTSWIMRASTPAQWFWPVAAAILPPTDPCWPGSAAEHVPWAAALGGKRSVSFRVGTKQTGHSLSGHVWPSPDGPLPRASRGKRTRL